MSIARHLTATGIALALAAGSALARQPQFELPQVSPKPNETPVRGATTNLYGQFLSFLPPAWAVRDAAGNRKQGRSTFLLEFVPKAEGFERWTKLFGLKARQSAQHTVGAEAAEIERLFRSGCDPRRTVLLRSGYNGVPVPPDGGVLFTIFCGAFRNDDARGEIAVMRVMKRADVTVRLYQEWRGASFDPADRESHPALAAEVAAANRRLSRARFVRQ